MNFMLGCNYWASNAGADMWRAFDPSVIERDLEILSTHGVEYLRVFPTWREFQPVEPLYTAGGALERYVSTGENPYFLDETMLSRFDTFLNLCEKYNVKAIVGLLTGWMSGGLLIPPALYKEDLIASPLAHYFEQLFIKGFVTRFKDRACIYAWDLGNECNAMGCTTDRYTASSWVAMVANAIKAADPDRMVVSGMHGLSVDGVWNISDHGEFCDLLTTHPYPFWCEHTRIDETMAFRTTLLPTAQSRFYADISGKPCLAEELGTMGPMVCSHENAVPFIRIHLFSLWANGAKGLLWWCGHEQSHLTSFPYSEQMGERELGLVDGEYKPRPVLIELAKFANWLKNLDFKLPPAQTDAVCLLTRDQDQWGVGYMTYALAKQAGLNCSFAYADEAIPDAKRYLMPSADGIKILQKKRYEALKEKVRSGADLYISLDNAIFSEFEELAGVHISDSFEHETHGTTTMNGVAFSFSRLRTFHMTPTTATVLAKDSDGNLFCSVNRYGNGRVFLVNAPIERTLIDRYHAFDGNTHLIYKSLFATEKVATLSDDTLLATYHPMEDRMIVVILNHFAQEKAFTLTPHDGYRITNVLYGEPQKIGAYDACVLELKKA